MKLMATLFILLVTVAPSFAESIMESLFAGEDPNSVQAKQRRHLFEHIVAVETMCSNVYPDDRDLFLRCRTEALQPEIQALDTREQQEQLYKQLDLRVQQEHETYRQQRDAQIDAARMQRETQLEAARIQAAGMILQGFALRPIIPTMQPYNPPPLPAFVPSPLPRSLPPVSCSTSFVGAFAQTDCY